MFCQLEILRQCLPSSVKRFLDELPESLDDTYERMLREIKKPNRDHVQRVMECLLVAIRPLRVEELAEVLAVDFEDAGGVPKLKPNWRLEDQEQALLASCSSLIVIVDTGYSRVVQFAHFSVKEYLTSSRVATSSQDISRYHIALEPAHTILAQACVSVLLQLPDLDEEDDIEANAPLAEYAAEYWVRHAQFGDVVSRIKGMEYLFDSDKPYFATWLLFHDIDYHSFHSVFPGFVTYEKSVELAPLYYAALCGFRNLVEQLIVKYPEHVNAICGLSGTPAVAALAGRHFEVAQILHRSGSFVDPRCRLGTSPLHRAAYVGNCELIQVLLDYGVEVDAQDTNRMTPLANAAYRHPRAVRLLFCHGADPNAQSDRQPPYVLETPLYRAIEGSGRIDIVRPLLEHGASVEVKNGDGKTPLDVAAGRGQYEIVKLLSEHGTKR